MIFVDVKDVKITVSGDTYPLSRKLGAQGFGMKFSRDRKRWTGSLSLKTLEFLANQSGTILTTDAKDAMDMFYRAAEKRAAYMASRAAGVA